jgi:hypothetical protein
MDILGCACEAEAGSQIASKLYMHLNDKSFNHNNEKARLKYS